MARGRFFVTGTVLDTASDPDDTEIAAAPGAGEQIYLQWLTLTIVTGQASSTISLEAGAGGTALLHHLSTATDVGSYHYNFAEHGADGLALGENVALNATIDGATGVVANVSCEYVVR